MTADAVGGVWHYALGSVCRAARNPLRAGRHGADAERSTARRRRPARQCRRLKNTGIGWNGCRARPAIWMRAAHWLTLLARRYRRRSAACERLRACPQLDRAANSRGRAFRRAVVVARRARRGGAARVGPVSARSRRRVCAPPTGSWRLPPPCSTIWRAITGSTPAAGTVIPNGIDIAFYAPQPKRAAIMAAGRLWDEAKNLALLDEAAADLDWPVEIAGEASHPRAVRPVCGWRARSAC